MLEHGTESSPRVWVSGMTPQSFFAENRTFSLRPMDHPRVCGYHRYDSSKFFCGKPHFFFKIASMGHPPCARISEKNEILLRIFPNNRKNLNSISFTKCFITSEYHSFYLTSIFSVLSGINSIISSFWHFGFSQYSFQFYFFALRQNEKK